MIKDYWTTKEIDELNGWQDLILMNETAYKEFKDGIVIEKIR